MSTRAQVQVIQEGVGWHESITLYHHTDGYPSHMIDCLLNAKKIASGTVWGEDGYTWELGRAGKAASFLCSSDPGTMEPEAGHALHGDIEYLYRLYVVNEQGGSLAEIPYWELEILTPKSSDRINGKCFWDHPSVKKMDVLQERTRIEAIQAEDLE